MSINETERPSGKKPQGFAAMDPDLQREISRRGGASHASKDRAFSKDPELAKRAALKSVQMRAKAAEPSPKPLRPQVEF